MSFVSITYAYLITLEMLRHWQKWKNARVSKHTNLIQPDDVVVLERFQYLNFAVEFAQVARVQLAFVNDFDRHLMSCEITYTMSSVSSLCADVLL